MQRKLLVPFLLWGYMHRVIVTADCNINPSVNCVNNLGKDAHCINLSGECEDGNITDTTKMGWYRCDRAHLSCQEQDLIYTDNVNDSFNLSSRTGLLCFRKLNKSLTGVYCYQANKMENSTCKPIQVVIVGT